MICLFSFFYQKLFLTKVYFLTKTFFDQYFFFDKLFLDLGLPEEVITLVVGLCISVPVRKYLRDRSLVFSNFLHAIRVP